MDLKDSYTFKNYLPVLSQYKIETDCDKENRHYFERSRENSTDQKQIIYIVKFPGVFRRKEKGNYSIHLYVQEKYDYTQKNITLNEYFDITNTLWDIKPGHYKEKNYFDNVNKFLQKLHSEHYYLDSDHCVRISNKIKNLLQAKKIIATPIASKSWFSSNWSDQDMHVKFLSLNDDSIKGIGLRIVFAQKSFGCFIAYKIEEER
jgi:hypothetical protein